MKTIRIDGQVKLVEWSDNSDIHRAILPLDSDDLDLSISYGLPFTRLLIQAGHSQADAKRLERKLHRAGVWTIEDLESKPGLMETIGLTIGNLRTRQIPDLRTINWQRIQDDIARLLEEKEIYSLEDIHKNDQEFLWCIKAAFTKPLIELYRRHER